MNVSNEYNQTSLYVVTSPIITFTEPGTSTVHVLFLNQDTVKFKLMQIIPNEFMF